MPITFNCEHCGKKIEAQDSAAGKRGKCPSCRRKVDVPGGDSDDLLKLAPVDASDEIKQRQLMAETYKLTQDILLEIEAPDGPAEAARPSPEISDEQLTDMIIGYLRKMADGRLDQAEETAKLIASFGIRSLAILDRMALDEIPETRLADIPQQVLSGLIRNLRSQVN